MCHVQQPETYDSEEKNMKKMTMTWDYRIDELLTKKKLIMGTANPKDDGIYTIYRRNGKPVAKVKIKHLEEKYPFGDRTSNCPIYTYEVKLIKKIRREKNE